MVKRALKFLLDFNKHVIYKKRGSQFSRKAMLVSLEINLLSHLAKTISISR